MNHSLTSRAFLAAGFGAAFAGAAHADCAAVIAAYTKADATHRFALFEVDSLAEAPKGDPLIVNIGQASFTQEYVRKGPLQFVKGGYRKGGYAEGSEAGSLKSREQKHEVRCEPLGERKIGTEPAIGYQIRSDSAANQADPTAIHLWVSRSSGLPIFHGMGSDGGGFRWVFGPGVTEPVPGKTGK